MKVTFQITRKDIWKQRWWAQQNITFCRNFNIIFYLYWLWQFSNTVPKDKGMLVVLIYMLLVSILFIVFLVALNSVLFVIDFYLSNKRSGLICEHSVEITVDGLREKTEANDTFRQWEYIDKIKANKKYIYYCVGRQHLGIPKKAFESDLEAEQFFQKALLFWLESRKK